MSISRRDVRARSPLVVSSLALCACVASVCLREGVAHADPSKLPPQIGYNYDEIETARDAGTAGAQRAASNSLTALFVNPANIATTHVYHLGVLAQIWPEASRQSYGAAAVDSIVSSTHLAGGVGATLNFQDNDGVARKWTDIRAALAYPVSDQFFLGVGLRYMWLTEDGMGPLGTSLASSGLPNARIVRDMTFDAGATLKPNDHFAVSVVGNNLNNPGHGFQPTSFGGGANVTFGDFGGEGDVVADFTTWNRTTLRAMLGLEALFADHFELRLGYRYDDGAKSHALAGGLGYIDRTFDVDVSVRRTVVGDAATAVVFGFTYHLDATGLAPSTGENF